MNMKKILSMAVAFLLVAGSTLMAQPKQGNKQPQKLTEEQISQKFATRMATNLQLDEDKTAKFVPIYVEYRADLKKVWEKYADHPKAKPEKPQPGAEKQKPRQCTDEELEKMNANRFARSRATIDVEETYYKRFLTVLTQRQYEKMKQLEKMNLQRMKNERMRRMPNGKFNGKPNGQFKGKPNFPQRPNGGDAKQRKAPVAENSATNVESVEQQSKKSERWISMNGVPVEGVPTTSGIYMNSKGERVYFK